MTFLTPHTEPRIGLHFDFEQTKEDLWPKDELDALQKGTHPGIFRQKYEASFEAPEGRVYYCFSREQNVTEFHTFPDAPLLVGMDFNVNPMTAVIAQKAGDQCHLVGEIILRDSNTFEMVAELLRRYPERHIVVHPDPTVGARKTSAPAGQTDIEILHRAHFDVYSSKPYPIVDRLNTVNAMLCNSKGERKLLISPDCAHLIRALDTLTYKEGTKFPDKSSGLDHITDALGYLVMAAFPLAPRNEWSVYPVHM